MIGVAIKQLNEETRKLIDEKNLDTNGDGKINRENNELANLLSQAGVKDIEELADTYKPINKPLTYGLFGATGAFCGLISANFIKSGLEKPTEDIMNQIIKNEKTISNIKGDLTIGNTILARAKQTFAGAKKTDMICGMAFLGATLLAGGIMAFAKWGFPDTEKVKLSEI